MLSLPAEPQTEDFSCNRSRETRKHEAKGSELVVEEERTVRKPADKVIAPVPVLLDNPVLSHVDVIPKTRLLYQFYCINKLRPFIPAVSILLYQ